MASLTGNLVAETYKALLKTIDNDILTASEKQITDGLGGGSNVFIDSNGFLRANKYKVTNGLATQFLKADGSLDANTYLTSITGAQVITALGYTPVTNQRTLTINGVGYNLSADRSWTVEGTAAVWGNITGTLSNQTDLQAALNAKFNVPAGTISQYIRGDGTLATFPTLPGGLPIGGTAGQILSKIDATDYNAQWIDNFATQTKNEVKLGQTLAKGAAVYVSSANGTNMIVSAASNASESLSSKTFGLLETGGVTNDLVKCVTFGLLAGLDTSTAQAGDPVWLGVNGALLFGVANKPVAPANMVYIGVVTRVQQNNGEIFVNVQNGFEIEELHDVLIQSKANNQGLFYESSTGLWKNKSIATVLGYTPQAQLDGTGFVKASGTTISYDNSTYLTTADAASTYQLLTNLSTDLTASATKYPSVNAVIAGLATKQPLDADLTAIAGLAGTSGFLIKTAADTWALDTNTYLTTTVAASTYQRLDKMVSNLLASSTEYPNSNAVLAKLALKADAANPVFTGDLTISGATPRLYFVDTDQNPDYTIFVDSGYFYIYDQTAGATKFQITPSGNAINTGTLTSASFIKSGGTASQFLMADGSVTTGVANPVGGTGTTNYLSKWTSASGIGNSIAYDNGNAIVLGTGTINSIPSWMKLITTDTIQSGFGSVYNNKAIYIYNNGSNIKLDAYDYATDAGLNVQIGGNGGNILMPSGSVLIGNPLYSYGANSLVVYANKTGNAGISIDNALASGSATTSLFLYNAGSLKMRFDYNKTDDTGIIGSVAAIPLTFWTNNSSKMTLTSNGYLGLNTPPTFRFHVVDNQSAWASVSDNSNGTENVSVYNAHGGGYGIAIDSTSNDSKYIFKAMAGTGGSGKGSIPVIYAMSNGNVGIGTTTPLQIYTNRTVLTVNGTSQSIINLGVGNSLTTYLYGTTSGSELYSTSTLALIAGGANALTFYTNGSERSRFTSAGNFLVNSTTSVDPVFKFQVGNGSSDSRGLFYPNNPYAIGIANGGSSFWYLGVNAQTASNGLQFYSNQGGIAMTLTTGNLVGLSGNTTPEYRVDLCPYNAETPTDVIRFGVYNGPGGGGGNALGTGILWKAYYAGYTRRSAGIMQIAENNYFRAAIGFFTNDNGNQTSDWSERLRIHSAGNATFYSYVTATAFFESSDSRLKKLIDGSAQIAGIENLQAKLYEKNGKMEFGYFAQDAQEFMPYAVEKNMDGFLSLSYREVHTAKIARLEQRVAELEKQLNAA
jgi:hypothetical protein